MICMLELRTTPLRVTGVMLLMGQEGDYEEKSSCIVCKASGMFGH